MKPGRHILKRLMALFYKPLQMHGHFFLWMYLLGLLCIMLINAFGKHVAVFELFLDLYVVTALLSLLPQKVGRWAEVLLMAFFYILAFVDVFCNWRFGAPMGPAFIFNCLQTDGRETGEALSTFLNWRILLSPVMLVALLGVVQMGTPSLPPRGEEDGLSPDPSPKRERSLKGKEVRRGVVLFLLLCFCGYKSSVNKQFLFHNYFVANDALEMEYAHQLPYTTGFYLPIYRFMEGLKAWSIHQNQVKKLVQRVELTNVDSCSFRSPCIVLIIGESYNRHHAQLYGYPLPTTPWQSKAAKDSSLTCFTDVVAPFHQTSEVFKTLFSLYAYGEQRPWDDYSLFPALFRKAGYNVCLMTNQFVKHPQQDIWDFSGGSILNDERLSAAQFSHRNTMMHKFDEGLLEDYDSLKQYRTGKDLIIFHLLGQHFDYSLRFPKEKAVFSPHDYHRPELSQEELEKLVAYDNATYYNDQLLKKIVHRFSQEEAIIIYVPDHGELMFDGSKTFGRSFEVTTPNEVYQQFEIPFWIWMSNSYREKHPEIVREVKDARKKPFMTDNLDQMLLYLGGIYCQDYRQADNPLSPNYNCSRPRLLMGKMDYDRVMGRSKK